MALSFPLGPASFLDILPISGLVLDLPEAVQISRTAGGAVLSADVGDRLWAGAIDLGPMSRAEAQLVQARLSLLRPSGRSFLVYDKGRPGPLADPTGAILGSAAPVIEALASSGREIRLGGLPAGYVLSAGDCLSWTYGTNPLRYAYHQLVTGDTAGAGGVTDLMEVDPVLRAGVAAGTSVRIVKPLMKARLIPGSVEPGRRRATLTEGVSFRFQQMIGV